MRLRSTRSKRQRPGRMPTNAPRVLLASQLIAAELYQEGFDYFAARSDSTPADALWLALADAFSGR